MLKQLKSGQTAKKCKTGHIGHINFLNKGGLNKFFNKFGINCNLSYLLVTETMSPLVVWSEVCMAHFNVPSTVCITPITPHMDGSNADFAPHMEQRHSFRDQIITKTAKSPIS